MTFQSLLPQNATPLEVTIEEASNRAYAIDFAIEALDNPDTMPEAFVSFQAWGWSTDLWDRAWPIEKKRAAVKAWYRLHRKKGTLAGIEEAVRFFDAKVVAVRRPPDATYPDPSLTKAERERYLARFQQLRFYRYRDRGIASFGAYFGSGYRLSRLFAGGKAFPTFTDAGVRIGTRAFLFDPLTGLEVPVKRATRTFITETREAVEFDEVALPSRVGKAAFLGRPPIAKVFTVDMEARKRIYSVRVDASYSETKSALHISGVLPSTQPIDVRSRKARLPGKRVIGQLFPSLGGRATEFLNRKSDGIHRTFLPPSTARNRIFDQVYLFDPGRQPDKRGARTFLGNTRLGMPAFNARLTIETRSRISRFAVSGFVHGFFVKTDKSRLNKAVEAVRLSKSLRDKILVTSKTMRPARAGDGFKVGTISVGTWVRDL